MVTASQLPSSPADRNQSANRARCEQPKKFESVRTMTSSDGGTRQKEFFYSQRILSTSHPPLPDPPDPGWAKLWSLRTWPKISIFLWLVHHRCILTWDNILKRGFSGPSRCALCYNNEESIDHLLDNFPFSNNIWDNAVMLCRKSDRAHGNITHTLKNWADNPYQNTILNRLWQLLPGFIVWNIWKECNRRIFEDQSSSEDTLWETCRKQMLETIHLQSWSDLDFKAQPNEALILQRWDITPATHVGPHSSTYSHMRSPSSPEHWCPPPHGFLKLNFDGASKGNPGPVRDLEVSSETTRVPLSCLYYGAIGHDKNNVAELSGLLHGLRIARQRELFPLLVEGDSQLIISMEVLSSKWLTKTKNLPQLVFGSGSSSSGSTYGIQGLHLLPPCSTQGELPGGHNFQ
jgi:hypothetical protein